MISWRIRFGRGLIARRGPLDYDFVLFTHPSVHFLATRNGLLIDPFALDDWANLREFGEPSVRASFHSNKVEAKSR
jgi:hypothetical protein